MGKYQLLFVTVFSSAEEKKRKISLTINKIFSILSEDLVGEKTGNN